MVQNLVSREVATEYFHSGGRKERGEWFKQNIPEMHKKIKVVKNFQVFSFDHTSDSFTFRKKEAFQEYIKTAIFNKARHLKASHTKEESAEGKVLISNEINVVQEGKNNNSKKKGKKTITSVEYYKINTKENCELLLNFLYNKKSTTKIQRKIKVSCNLMNSSLMHFW